MVAKRLLLMGFAGFLFCAASIYSRAGDIRIAIPRHSSATPVQSLNRKGVEAIRKQEYAKAKACFYRAYLLDPDDPFTLNNMGYIAELEGDVNTAQRFYSLASQMASDAMVSEASSPHLAGQTFLAVTQPASVGTGSAAMQINRGNVQAIRLFSQQRAPEADTVLTQTLKIDPNNAFTLNNLGVAKEAEGDFAGAMQYYSAAANAQSRQSVIVTSAAFARGKPVSEIAAANIKRLQKRIQDSQNAESKVALLNMRGVSAINRNSPREGALDFLEAYKVDPTNAFTLNNLGYVAELDGDLEGAQTYYEDARRAQKAAARVGLATRSSAEGQKLFEVADDSDRQVESHIEAVQEEKHRESKPIQLKRRDGQPVQPQSAAPQSSVPEPTVPRPENSSTPTQ
jgi:Flp pilus assembly protein TadD